MARRGEEGRTPPPGARGFRLRLGRTGTVGGWVSVERRDEPEPELPLVGFASSGEAELVTAHSSHDARPSVRHWRVPLRRKRPVALRQWARLFALTFGGIGAMLLVEGAPRDGAVALVVAAALAVGFRLAPPDPTASPDFPYEQARRRPGDPQAEHPFATLPRPDRARRAALVATAVAGSWAVADPSTTGLLGGLALAAIAAVWANEIPLVPPRWVVVASAAAGGLVAFAFAGVAMMLSPLSDAPVLPAAVAAGVPFAAFSHVLLSLGVTMHRIDRSDLEAARRS